MWSVIVLALYVTVRSAVGQYGTRVGTLSENAHNVKGTVYIVDSKRILIREFYYDGTAPDPYFWLGEKGVSGANPDARGTLIADGDGSVEPLFKHENADVLLTVPQGKSVTDYQWLSVWCRSAGANFGSIQLSNLVVPAPQELTPTAAGSVVTSGVVRFLDHKRIQIVDFTYDGTANLFFYVGTSSMEPDNGPIVRDESGSESALGVYNSKTIILTLPESVTLGDITWLMAYNTSSLWSVSPVPVVNDIPPFTETGYYGTLLGSLTQLDKFGVSGNVYAADNKRLWLRLFNFDGQCGDTHFYIGEKGSSDPIGQGTRLANELGSFSALGMYTDAGVVLTLPGELVVGNLAWLSVWCASSQENLGSFMFPSAVSVPHRVDLGMFSSLAHSVQSGQVYALDKRTFRVEDFEYDGGGPDAFFLVGTGAVSKNGIKIPDEDGDLAKPGRYRGETIELRLPTGLTVDAIDYLTLYCIQFTQNFGDVKLDQSIYAVPPYIVEPQMAPMKNCEKMSDAFNVGWEIMGSDIVFEFTGALDGDDGYMTFGVSGSTTTSAMIGSDPMVVYLENGIPKTQDYTISAYSLCSGEQGVCPDSARSGVNNLEITSQRINAGVTTVRFMRPLNTAEGTVDKEIPATGEIYVVWAMGNVNAQGQVTKHKQRLTGDLKIEFGRVAAYNCQPIVVARPEPENVWPVQRLSGMDTKTFTALIGPTGGKQGYEGITGQVSWGISWYLNGLLIPEVTLRRGDTFTFKVHGGNTPANQARYHPLYITDDPLGGYADKTPQEQQMVTIYAGTSTNSPGGTVGSYCEWKSGNEPENYETFEAYAETLVRECDGAEEPGIFTWTPDSNTPDLVYYQCYTHNYLGWKIHVVDEYSSGAGRLTCWIYTYVAGLVAAFILSTLSTY